MTNIEKSNKEISTLRESHKEAVFDRIFAIAALKSLINDASGETELIKKATEKLNRAFCMEDFYVKQIDKTTKQLNELYSEQELSEAQTKREQAKEILGLGGNK